MRHFSFLLVLLSLSLYSCGQVNDPVQHNLHVVINPATSEIEVIDTLILQDTKDFIFSLNSNLELTYSSKNVKLKALKKTDEAKDLGMDRDVNGEEKERVKLNQWAVHFTDKSNKIVLHYKGKLASGMSESKENYQRSFGETSGTIIPKGVYLAGSTYWVPTVDGQLFTYNLYTQLPSGWSTVSQGERTQNKTHADNHFDAWYCITPQEEVFLIAAQFNEYSYDMNSGIKAMAFLRTPDEALANKYLEVTEQYMEMFQSMIGDYPYTKFALVENFWETGYGMPSFTLLGEKVIRFPFILHSSYPHELLHNWWGNSVYVDFDKGNWCEGITAYGADHLIKEQRGQGEEYRRSTLQKYSNFVTQENDFPVGKFVSRYDGPSEAIGYGKSLMMWHMLRRKIGDENFNKGFSLFYKNNKYKAASFDDIRIAMEEVTQLDLKPFFDQWVLRTGAPELSMTDVKMDMYGGSYRVYFKLNQVQSGDAFIIDVPVAIATKEGVEIKVFNMSSKKQEFQIELKEKPLKLVVDPQYDVFRKLDPREVPPAFSKALGSKENVIILPSEGTEEEKELLKAYADAWIAGDGNSNYTLVEDSKIKQLPEGKTIWIFGLDNKYASMISEEMKIYNGYISADTIQFGGKKVLTKSHGFMITTFAKDDVNNTMVFMVPGKKEAIPGLIRKLPHYGKYSYLGFEGDEPTNMAKGQWAVVSSPLIKLFDESAQGTSVIEDRKALAEIKPVFSEKRMMKHIKYMASDEMKGRGLGTPELDQVADYIAAQFKAYGLKPMGNDYFQSFEKKFPPNKASLKMKNVIAVIPGSDPKLKDSPVVLSAHYDHLGLGWPDVHQGDEGKIHNGADDNASGVAIMLELAKSLSKSKPKRTIIFLAATAEEAGLIGSRYFVEHIAEHYSGAIFANVNLDTDGSLFDKKLLVLNANTAKEWKFIFMGTDYTTGVKTEVVPKGLDASDQVAFIEKRIPAVQLFTGATENYHRPKDTYEKIDGKGLVKVATVAKEVIVYLADRENAMPFTGDGAKPSSAPQHGSNENRKVSTGSIPDFAYSGKGVKVGSVVEGSAGNKAGLLAGDVITAINGKEVEDLKAYSQALKEFKPGDSVKLSIQREGKEMSISITLGAR